ncbi:MULTISPECIES: hypothetical protein [unclassified Moorena]|uniref:hypothetical protein n=1 Tax=unclassified Moorena TaxID=2683338 RepID=UPI0013C149D5|nr:MULTISPECIES: hypothetical protein [unclassified Moorena]NEP35838.1 hypothetical protein [Moorena sp. SIO3B2]NET64083.1 hypothetical protein [Moorena sp. SIO1G6]
MVTLRDARYEPLRERILGHFAIDLGLSATLREWSRYAMLGTSRYANAKKPILLSINTCLCSSDPLHFHVGAIAKKV